MYHTFDSYQPCIDRERHSEKTEIEDAAEFARTRLKFEPDERQSEVLRSTAKRGMLNCSRQWGKSTIAAAKAVHRAFTQDKSLVLVASPTDRQSAELIRKAAEMVATLGIAPRGDGDNKTSLLFPNGSRIVGLPGMEARVPDERARDGVRSDFSGVSGTGEESVGGGVVCAGVYG